MSKRRNLTAEEVVALLAKDADYQRRMAEQEVRLAQAAADFRKDEESVIRDLNAAGIPADSLNDFMSSAPTPMAAAPILLRHLTVPHIPRVRDIILRVLADSHLRSVALAPLLEMFRSAADPNERWLLANAISTMAPFNEVTHVQGLGDFRGLFER